MKDCSRLNGDETDQDHFVVHLDKNTKLNLFSETTKSKDKNKPMPSQISRLAPLTPAAAVVLRTLFDGFSY